MSTFFATFSDLRPVENLLEELLRSGVRPDDISVVSRYFDEQTGAEMSEQHVSVGDATVIVGRDDDPQIDENSGGRPDLTTSYESPISGIDTSDTATNVESADQADESQWLAEDSLEPPRMTSHSEHEVDDLALTLRTDFPTEAPLIDDIKDSDGPRQDQLVDSLERISIPGKGTIIGGGSLATAAFDVINPAEGANSQTLIKFLSDEGLPSDCADNLAKDLEEGRTVLAVEITPGAVSEEFIEEAAARHGAEGGALYDAPRFHEGGFLS